MAELEKKGKRQLTHDAYTVGWVCVLLSELNASRALLDEEHEQLQPDEKDDNRYLLGRMGKHNVVITFPGSGVYGPNAAAQIVTNIVRTFRNIRFGLMVGVGGGAPKLPHPDDPLMDIRLGDVVVSNPKGKHGGVLYYDMGKWKDDGKFDIESHLNKPPKILLKGIELLQSDHDFGEGKIKEYISEVAKKSLTLPALKKYRFPGRDKDQLFRPNYPHVDGQDCSACELKETEKRIERDFDDPVVHYGLIASGHSVMRSAQRRDELRDAWNVSCFEMEAAGLMDDFPCIVIRGICDYSDDHKNKLWQPYSAVVAAAYAKDLLRVIQPREVENTKAVIGVIKEMQEDVAAIAGAIWKDQRNKILDWIASPTYHEQHIDIVEQQQPGTGQWFLDSPEFNAWVRGESQTLFCPGIPGAGKTVLASIAVEHLLRLTKDGPMHVTFLYCNYRGHEDQTAEKLLAALLRQLVEQSVSIPEPVEKLYSSYAGKSARPSPKEVFSTLLTVASTLGRMFIVVDALDECSHKTRVELLLKIQELQRTTKTGLLATSRPIDEIQQSFAEGPQLKIQAHRGDVEKYVDSQLVRLSHCVRSNPGMQEKIKKRVAEAVDGMFLLARLNMNSLGEKMTELEVEEALEDMGKGPTDLAMAYNDAVNRINYQAEGHRNWAHRILSWLLYARRPLRSIELQHALAVRPGDNQIELKNLPNIGELISLCAGLVTLNQESRIVQLVHYSTQQFFKNMKPQPEWIYTAERNITTICVTYLSFDDFQTGFCPTDQHFEERLQSNVLYEYAARNWGHHARAALDHEEQLILSFLECEGKVSASSQAMMASTTSLGRSQRVVKQVAGVQLAAYFGLSNALKSLLKNGHDPDLADCHGQTPLSFAAENGHETVVKLLLTKDRVEPDSKANGYWNGRTYSGRTPLSFAAANGHEAVVKLLLATPRVDPDSKATDHTDDGRTPLSFAAMGGHTGVVKLLLSKAEVDPDSKATGYYQGRTPLSLAAEEGHEAIIKLLLTKDAVDPDSKATRYGDDSGRTPLSFAAAGGHEAVIKALLAKDRVNPDSKASNGRTPLSFAAAGGHEAVAKLLLSKDGVDPDCMATSFNDIGRTPLSFAAAAGHERMVKLLLASDRVSPDSMNNNRQTPLSFAAIGGHEAVVKLLLAKDNVNPDSKVTGYDTGRTPLSLAAAEGHDAVVKLLLAKNRVDPDSMNSTRRTPLSFAAAGGHEAVVKLLLAKNRVDPNSKDSNGRTPLSFAAANGCKAVVRLLLAYDEVIPDSKATGYYSGRTPLSLAAEEGHTAVVRLLLAKNGVDPESISYKRQTPLSFAATGGHVEVVKLLLAREEVNPDSMSYNGQTPLSLAAAGGYEAVVRLLLATDKVDPDSKDSNARTPLSFAAEKGHEAIVRLLLDQTRVNAGFKDSRGQTPLSYAAAFRRRMVVGLLQSYQGIPQSPQSELSWPPIAGFSRPPTSPLHTRSTTWS